jgi:hypothetical protein
VTCATCSSERVTSRRGDVITDLIADVGRRAALAVVSLPGQLFKCPAGSLECANQYNLPAGCYRKGPDLHFCLNSRSDWTNCDRCLWVVREDWGKVELSSDWICIVRVRNGDWLRLMPFYYYYYCYYLIELQIDFYAVAMVLLLRKHITQNYIQHSKKKHNTQSYTNNKGHITHNEYNAE